MITVKNPKNNEVLGFEDGTSKEEMEFAVKRETSPGELTAYNPSWYDRTLAPALSKIGITSDTLPFVVARKAYAGAVSGVASLTKVFPGEFEITKQLEKEVGAINKYSLFGTKDVTMRAIEATAEMAGSMLPTLPIDIATGGVLKSVAIGKAGIKAGEMLSRIPGFAIGAGVRAGVTEAKKGVLPGLAATAETGILMTAYGNTGEGAAALVKMGVLGAVGADIEALKQGRMATNDERIMGAASGVGVMAAIHATGALKETMPEGTARTILERAEVKLNKAIESGDFKVAEEVYKELLEHPDLPELYKKPISDAYTIYKDEYYFYPDKDMDLLSKLSRTHMIISGNDSYETRKVSIDQLYNDVCEYNKERNPLLSDSLNERSTQELLMNESDRIISDKDYVYEDVRNKLVENGISEEQADSGARLWAARAEVEAKNQGILPGEWYKNNNFTMGEPKTKVETHVDLMNQSTIGDLVDNLKFMGESIENTDNPLNMYFQQDKLKWTAPHKEPIFGVVNNRLSKELEILERLVGKVSTAVDLPGKYVEGVRELTRSIRPHDLGAKLIEMKANGSLARLLDPKVDPNELAKERGLTGKDLEKFNEEIKTLRSETDILSDNGKAEASVDLLIATCQPTTPCQECYASETMIRRSTVQKAFRNTALMLNNPKDFGRRIAAEVAKKSKTQLPFVRLQGSGDMTMSEAVEAYNELAKNADRPIHIFSRHHDNLAKLVDGANAPFKKMGSVDSQLYDYYGRDYLIANKKERGIDNAWLFTSKEEIPLIMDLAKNDAISLILATDKSLHDALPVEAKKTSCPCDADERTYFGSCRRCATSSGGCWMSSVNSGIDAKGKVWDIKDSKAPKDLKPLLESMFEAKGETLKGKELDPRSMSYAKIVADQAKKSIELINLYHRNYLKGESNTVTVKDIRFPGDAIKLVDVDMWKKANKGKPVPESTETVIYLKSKELNYQVEAYKERMRGIIDTALKGGTFYLPGGEIQEPIRYKNWKRMDSKEVDKLFQQPTGQETFSQGHRGYVELAKDPGSLHRIVMGAKGDISTFMHESAHIWLKDMNDFIKTGKANEQYTKDFNVLKDWLKIKEGQTEFTRKQHEQFARGFEKYLREGKAPVSSLEGVFQRFKEWLTDIYKNVKQLNVRLSDDVRGVMDNMLAEQDNPIHRIAKTQEGSKRLVESIMRQISGAEEKPKTEDTSAKPKGEIVPKKASSEKIVEKISQKVEKLAEQEGTLNPVKSEGKKLESKAFTRVQSRLEEFADNNPTYNKMNIAEDTARALKIVSEDMDRARKISLGLISAPNDVTDTAISIAYSEEMIRQGNLKEAARSESARSLRQTRRGQEIVAERGRIDADSSTYFVNQVIQARLDNLGRGLTSRLQKSSKGKAVEEIEKGVAELQKRLEKVKSTSAEVDLMKLYQNELTDWAKENFTPEELKKKDILNKIKDVDSNFNPTKAKEYLAELVSSKLDLGVTEGELKAIQVKVELMQAQMGKVDKFGLPNTEYWKARNEVNKLTQSFVPAHNLVVLTSLIGRGNMLASIASPLMNIESNAVHSITQALERRIETGNFGQIENKDLIKDYVKTTLKIFNDSGYDVSRMEGLPKEKLIRGEHMVHAQGEGKIRAIGRIYEDVVFKYMMGMPDVATSAIAFADRAMMDAVKIAKLNGTDAKELFLDSTRLEPVTNEGKLIRANAIADAQYTTFTNKGKYSEIALGFRNSLNQISDLRIGDQLMPFIKTPANVVQVGADYSGLTTIIKTGARIPRMIRELKKGDLSTLQEIAPSFIRGGLGMTLAGILVNLIDADDFTPDYSALTPQERELARLKNAPFNSVKIGNRYISLDGFSVLGAAFVGMLYAKKYGTNWQEKIYQYGKGAIQQSIKIPGAKELADNISNIYDQTNKAKGWVDSAGKLTNLGLQYAQARLVPRIWNNALAFMDDVKREKGEKWWSSLQAEIPGLRQKLPPVVSQFTGEPVKETPVIGLLFGSRVKVPNNSPLAKEISRLHSEGEIPSIAKLGNSGKMKELKEQLGQKKFGEALEYFGNEFKDQVETLINSGSYEGMSDEDKKSKINSVRERIIKRTLREFDYAKPEEK